MRGVYPDTTGLEALRNQPELVCNFSNNQRKVGMQPVDGCAGVKLLDPLASSARDPVRSSPDKADIRGTPPMTPSQSATARATDKPAAADASIAALERPTPAGANAPGFGSDVVAETLSALAKFRTSR